VEFDRGLGDALVSQEVGYLEPLIALELNDLAKFFVVNKSTVACKILRKSSSPCQRPCSPFAAYGALTFLKAFSNFFRSYSTIHNTYPYQHHANALSEGRTLR